MSSACQLSTSYHHQFISYQMIMITYLSVVKWSSSSICQRAIRKKLYIVHPCLGKKLSMIMYCIKVITIIIILVSVICTFVFEPFFYIYLFIFLFIFVPLEAIYGIWVQVSEFLVFMGYATML